LPSRRLIYGPGGQQIEWKSEKTAKMVVVRGNDCFRCIRGYLEGELDQKRRAEEVM